MRKIQIILLVLIIIGFGLIFTQKYWVDDIVNFILKFESDESININGKNMTLKIISSAFENGGKIPAAYTCDGEGVNPSIQISDAPAGTKSFVLISDDPDAPAGTWVHWLVWNIKPETREIAENSAPEGAISGTTSFGKTGYGGPCPHSGVHRYFFKVYALDSELDLSNEASKVEVEKAMAGHIIASGELMGRYERMK